MRSRGVRGMVCPTPACARHAAPPGGASAKAGRRVAGGEGEAERDARVHAIEQLEPVGIGDRPVERSLQRHVRREPPGEDGPDPHQLGTAAPVQECPFRSRPQIERAPRRLAIHASRAIPHQGGAHTIRSHSS